jgi:SAM-dependent methyltransferase
MRRLQRRVHRESRDAKVIRASADRLPLDGGSFDTVVATLVQCTVPHQNAALAEIHRALKPEGSLLVLEHVRSDDAAVARRQDRLQPLWIHVGHGCHCIVDTLAAIRSAGFENQRHRARPDAQDRRLRPTPDRRPRQTQDAAAAAAVSGGLTGARRTPATIDVAHTAK